MVDKAEYARKAINLLKTVVVNNSASVKKIIAKIEPQKDSDFIVSDFSNEIADDEIIAFMKEYGLTNPRELVKFFVEVHFATIDDVFDGFGELKQDILKADGLSFIADARTKQKKNKLEEAEDDLCHGFHVLEGTIRECVNTIRNIDNLNGIEFAIGAVFGNRKKSERATSLARMAIDGFFEVIYLDTLIYNQLITSTKNTADNILYEECNDLMNFLCSGDTCRLMYSYDNNKKDGFWLGLPDRIKIIKEENSELRDFFDVIDDDDIESYENIIL